MFRYLSMGALWDRSRTGPWAGAAGIALALICAASATTRADGPEVSPAEVRAAVEKSLSLIERSTAEYRRRRECFSCHHQALPVLMLTEARRRGLAIDEENYREQIRHTAASLEGARENYLEGRGQGGKADMAGWALWTLEAGDWKPDQTTAAVAGFLLSWQDDLDHWRPPSHRPPTEASEFTTTYVALRGLTVFGTPEQDERLAARREAARQWLLRTAPQETEDRVFRLRALSYLGEDEAVVREAAQELIRAQRDDGGWAQRPEQESDAYATATALAALHDAGDLPVTDPVYRRGVAFLVRSQHEDGSWHVRTRSKPIQTYFESGYPHGKDQFISIAAGSWATYALLLTCPVPSP